MTYRHLDPLEMLGPVAEGPFEWLTETEYYRKCCASDDALDKGTVAELGVVNRGPRSR